MLRNNTFNLLKSNFFKTKIFPMKYFCEDLTIKAPPKFKTNLVDDFATAKKQVFWRIRNIGQKELEYILMKWYDHQTMTMEEMKRFSVEVLEMENPDMNKYFVKMEQAPENLEFTLKIQYFINNQY